MEAKMASYQIERLKEQMKEMFEGAARDINVSQIANYRIMVMMKDQMVFNGIPADIAERVAAKMNIKVDQALFDEDVAYFENVTESMAAMVGKMYQQIEKDFQADPGEILLSMAGQINIELTQS
jgi:hypothetical protein